MTPTWPSVVVAVFLLQLQAALSNSFIVWNNCGETIWPGILAGAGTPQLSTTGFRLDPEQTLQIPTWPAWSGRIWARTGCMFDDTGNGSCQTGDCGGRMECNGMGPQPPVTLFEITLGDGEKDDFYDISMVDGYNLPVVAAPRLMLAGEQCNATGCLADLNIRCPKELQVEGDGGGIVACRSACEVFGTDEYCCSGPYANPTTCGPSSYSAIFKLACPRAYSYAFDDSTSTFTCRAADYIIAFCPGATGLSKSTGISIETPTRQAEENGQENTSSAYAISFQLSILIFMSLL